MEALNAWRGVKPTEEDKATKTVRFEGQPSAKKNFFAAIDTNETNWDVNCLPSFAEGGTGTEGTTGDLKYQQSLKDSCWQCYKLFPRAQNVPCKFVAEKVSQPL